MEDTDEDDDFLRESSAERIIRLTGDISEETSESFIHNLHKVAELPGEISVVISSDGGDVEEGLRIIDALNIAKTKGCPVHTVVSGKAYSMAAYIFCVGDTRTMYPHARLMFHPGRYEGSDGEEMTASTLKSMHDELTMFDNTFRSILRGVGVDPELIERMMNGDVYMSAEEAIAKGIVHSIETQLI